MNTSPSSVTGTNETACSTIAAPPRDRRRREELGHRELVGGMKRADAPGVGAATPTTSIVITRNEPVYGNVM